MKLHFTDGNLHFTDGKTNHVTKSLDQEERVKGDKCKQLGTSEMG